MQSNTKLTRFARRCLRAAGWFPGRRIQLTGMANSLEREQFVLTDAAARFLEEFGELSIGPPFPSISFLDRFLNWTVCWRIPKQGFSTTLESFTKSYYQNRARWVELYKQCVPGVCLIGEGYDGQADLFISPAGGMFGGRDESLWRIGDDPIDGINQLCAGTDRGDAIDVDRVARAHK